MNQTEKKMFKLLQRGKEHFGVIAVKAEFEAEGTRVDELLRLLDISRSADLPIGVKIGGCEAIRDLLEAKQFGTRYIIAPMVESDYALSKYVKAKNFVYSEPEREDTDFLANIETRLTFENRQAIFKAATVDDGIKGFVFGRSDYAGSLGLSGNDVNSKVITQDILTVASLCKEKDLDLVVGGGVSIDSKDALTEINLVHLTRFETRKIIFSNEALKLKNIKEGLLNAVHFEMLWLLNKRDYYGRITQEDSVRIDTLEKRWGVLSRDI
jgi:hypothetical protein